MKYGIIILYNFDPSWLRLSRDERGTHERVFQEEIVGPAAGALTIRHFDAEAFSAEFSDFLLVETEDLQAYSYFIERLRDSDFIAQGWACLKDISIGIQDGYKEYEHDLV